MGKNGYIGVDSVAKKVKNIYVGDESGVAKKVKKGFVGESDVAKEWWSNGEKAYLVTFMPVSTESYVNTCDVKWYDESSATWKTLPFQVNVGSSGITGGNIYGYGGYFYYASGAGLYRFKLDSSAPEVVSSDGLTKFFGITSTGVGMGISRNLFYTYDLNTGARVQTTLALQSQSDTLWYDTYSHAELPDGTIYISLWNRNSTGQQGWQMCFIRFTLNGITPTNVNVVKFTSTPSSTYPTYYDGSTGSLLYKGVPYSLGAYSHTGSESTSYSLDYYVPNSAGTSYTRTAITSLTGIANADTTIFIDNQERLVVTWLDKTPSANVSPTKVYNAYTTNGTTWTVQNTSASNKPWFSYSSDGTYIYGVGTRSYHKYRGSSMTGTFTRILAGGYTGGNVYPFGRVSYTTRIATKMDTE